MTKKLTEVFNLAPNDDEEMDAPELGDDNHQEMLQLLDAADDINDSLPQIMGVDSTDKDFDEYAKKSVGAFQDLCDLASSVEDRLVADLYTAASSMIGNALTAKQAKISSKVDMIKLQIQYSKLKLEADKLEFQKQKFTKSDSLDAEEGDLIEIDRTEFLRSLIEEATTQKKKSG